MSKKPMMATELIAKLAELIREHGDQPIGVTAHVGGMYLDDAGDAEGSALSVSPFWKSDGQFRAFDIYSERIEMESTEPAFSGELPF